MRQHGLRLAALLLTALVSGCGTVNPSPSPSGSTSEPPTAGPTGPAAPASIRAYFGLGSTAGNPILAPVERPAPAGTDVTARARGAMEALIAGPSAAELSASPAMFTAMPAGTTLAGLQVDGAGVATADLSSAFEENDELPALRTALGQVVVTLTALPGVTGVQVTIKGAVLEQTDAAGQQLQRPATRADYGDQLGPIFVDAPAWGATVRAPMHLAGLADVFEAQFQFRLFDADGRSLANGSLKASCGSGCLGTFGVDVPFNVNASTAGRLQVFDLSEADGKMAAVVDYPVTLLP
jgi:hypothetical protein